MVLSLSSMNPFPSDQMEPNYWLSCCIIDKEAMCVQTRTDREASFLTEPGKSCPTEIMEAMAAINAEGRPIWKPMHLQPMYQGYDFVTAEEGGIDVGADIFERGLCLPSDNKMTAEVQSRIIDSIKGCFV